MADLVAVELKMPDWFGRLTRGYNRLLLAIASDVQTNVGLRFDAEGAYNGHEKWKDLKTGANKKMAKNGLQARQILRRSGALKNSISPSNPQGAAGPNGFVRFEGDMKNSLTVVGTNLKYARIHNEGGLIQHPGTNNGFGRGIKIPPHSIEMPRRNFTDWSAADMRNLEKTIKNTAAEILNGK